MKGPPACGQMDYRRSDSAHVPDCRAERQKVRASEPRRGMAIYLNLINLIVDHWI
jgi:hypothetical protein